MHLRQSDLNKINANSVASNHVKCQKPRSKKRKWVRKAKENDFLERCGNVSESCLMFGYLIFVFFIIDISFCCKLRLLCRLYYTAKNAQVITTNKSVIIMQQLVRTRRYLDALAWLLWQFVDDKSVARYHHTCCKLIVQNFYQQTCCKLFQQILTSLQMTNCNKPDFNWLVLTW